MSAPARANNQGLVYALILTIGMIVVIGSALAFQYIGGYIPCELCLLQRQPYYYGIPIAAVAFLSAAFRLPPLLTRTLLAISGLLMIAGGITGIYHAGVEWHFWAGPTACSTTASSMTQDASNLLTELNTIKGPSCDAAALRILGLSMAGWNVIASAILAAIAFVAIRKTR